MEPSSQDFNEGEECHSSESGWTMYIGSPSNDEDDEMNCEGDFGEDDVGRDHKNINDDDDTDDSMASDASSGPSHIVRNANKSPIPKEKGNGKVCSNNKSSLKKGSIKNQDKEDYSVFSAEGAKVLSNSEKVRKSIWKGKAK